MNMDESIQVSCIIDKLPPSWKDFKHTFKHLKDELTLVELGSHLRIEESLRMQDSDKPKGNNVVGPSVVNMVEHNNSSRYNDNMGKRKHHDNTKADPNKRSKVTCWKCEKPGHLKKDCKGGKAGNKANGSGINGLVDGSTNSLKGETVHVCKDRCWFKTYELLNDISILHMGNESTALVHGRGCVDLRFSYEKIVSFLNILHVPNIKKDMVYNIKKDMVSNGLVMAVVRLPDPKIKTLGKRGIECIFVGYAEYSKAFRFYVIEPNDSVSINSIIESRDLIFDENRFSSVSRPSLRIPNRTEDIGGSVVPEEVTEEDVAFWKEAINDEMDSIMGNNTWELVDLPPVARISTIRLLIAMASIHNLIIHQMDVKIAFLNGDLDEEVYMNQPQGFIMPGNENKMCKLIKSLYGLKQTPKQWHQKFDEVVLSNGYLLNQADKCVYSKFDETGKGVIICLYVDDMLIFGTDQVQVELTKEFSSSKFSMKDMGEADVILGIRIKHESNGIAISQSHYIEKVLKKFNYFDCTIVSTPIDTSEKLMPNNGQACWKVTLMQAGPAKDNSSTSGWVFLLGGGANSWASKKRTCITSSIMEYEFVTLAAAGKEAKYAATLTKAYNQMYNAKSRHLGVRHSMIRELIMNEVISIEFVRSQQNLADHLTKGLTRDLVIKSAEGMRLKSN
ncbi:zinc finger, CCHC-type containing protein [Tanacetum coccineum]